MTGFFANKTTGNCPTKVDALYYEAAKLAANVIKRFNTKNFTTRKKTQDWWLFFPKSRVCSTNSGKRLLSSFDYQCVGKTCRFII